MAQHGLRRPAVRGVATSVVFASLTLHAVIAAGWIWLSPDADSAQASPGIASAGATLQVRTIEVGPDKILEAESTLLDAQLTAGGAGRETSSGSGIEARIGSRHHFDISEVDAPAIPQPDWNLDLAVLLAHGIEALSFEVMVSETGQPERCMVTRIQPPHRALEEALATQVCTTQLTPAMRRGVAVPSVRRIELLLAP